MAFVAVVDYGMGNRLRCAAPLEVCGASVRVTSDPADLARADRIVLPGVGAFGMAMDELRARGLDAALTEQVVELGAPFLGICLGMQLMAARSTEHGDHQGLGWVAGTVDRLVPTAADPRVPHVGWNEVHPTAPHPVFADVDPDRVVYFVHSYAITCDDPAASLATTPYAGGFTSVIGTGSAVGMQFHPEKSQQVGQQLLRNWLAWDGRP
ncbi:MAG: imidazole glycerol phosphate synthase subunit HisH [Acidimicrobiales bacterium]